MVVRVRTVDAVMVEQRCAAFQSRSIKTSSKLAGLRLAMSMLDLTTLEGKDSPEKVRSLCRKAMRPHEGLLPDGSSVPACAAVCVYPALVAVAKEALRGSTVKVASVATGFPSGQFPLDVRLRDVEEAVTAGADEIDMVINRGAFLAGRHEEVAAEIRAVKAACGPGRQASVARNPEVMLPLPPGRRVAAETEGRGEGHRGARDRRDDGRSSKEALTPDPSPKRRGESVHAGERGGNGGAHLKIILETGELETYDNVRIAADLAIDAASSVPGAAPLEDGEVFIKTSTGKVQPAATMPVTLIMLEAIRDHFMASGVRIGMKPAGGIRRAKEALHYLVMVKETLGDAWLSPRLFRFGASTLANDLLRQMLKEITGHYMTGYDFAEA